MSQRYPRKGYPYANSCGSTTTSSNLSQWPECVADETVFCARIKTCFLPLNYSTSRFTSILLWGNGLVAHWLPPQSFFEAGALTTSLYVLVRFIIPKCSPRPLISVERRLDRGVYPLLTLHRETDTDISWLCRLVDYPCTDPVERKATNKVIVASQCEIPPLSAERCMYALLSCDGMDMGHSNFRWL